MKYQGPLYGKIGNRTFDTGKTSANWDAMEAALKSAKDCIEANRRHIESMGRHAVEGTSSTLDEISNALMPNSGVITNSVCSLTPEPPRKDKFAR